MEHRRIHIELLRTSPTFAFRSRSYGERSIDSPRQCVFAGSVNHSAYLHDDTGARRFWPVACKAPVFDVEGLTSVRDQL